MRCTTCELARPTFHSARPICAADQEPMCAHSVSVSPMISLVIASGWVSWARQTRMSQEEIRLRAIAASSLPAVPTASKSASRWVASTWIVPCARDSRRSESILRTMAGIRIDRHSSSRTIMRTGPPSASIAAWPQDDTQARVIATVSSPRPSIRDRSTVWIGASKSGRTVVGPSNSPDREPVTMLPSASVSGLIMSRSSSTPCWRTRSSRAISGTGPAAAARPAGSSGQPASWRRRPAWTRA